MSAGDTGAGPGGAIADELAKRTLALCETPSETGHEQRLADEVEAFCKRVAGEGSVQRIGNSVICDPGAEGRHSRESGNPEGGQPQGDRQPASKELDDAAMGFARAPDSSRFRGNDGVQKPTVALVGHLDTVRCAEGQPTEIRDGRVYGCGSSDMKAGVATMMSLLERHRSLTSARPIWIFYDGEEGPHEGNGLEPVLAGNFLPHLDLALVLEPTDRTLQMGCMGTMHATVTVRGKRAHSARPWQGENAIYRATRLLDRFGAVQRREVKFGELTFYEVAVVTKVWTENSANVVPDRVMLNVNLRFAPGRTSEEATAELREIVGGDGEIVVTDAAPSGRVYLDHPLIEPWRRRQGLGVAPKQAWTDVARFTERGIPAVNFGPGETAQAHQSGEWCSIESLVHAYDNLMAFFTTTLADLDATRETAPS